MKKTVSWHTEILPKEEDTNADQKKSGTMTKSKSATPAATTNPQVNLRIQQMVAMQKAQNATMRQLMSNNVNFAEAASPSGLRDLVKTLPLGDIHAKSVQTTTASTANSSDAESPYAMISGGTRSTVSIKPPAKLPADNHIMDRDINYQRPLKHSYPPNQRISTSPILQNTPPLLYPKYPYGTHEESSIESPVSYNSVLDQHLTPSKVVERKRAQKQLQTIQSQHQMEMQKSESVEVKQLDDETPVNWANLEPTMDGYSLPQHSDYEVITSTFTSNNGLNIKDTMAKPVASFPRARPFRQGHFQQFTNESEQLLPQTDNNSSAHTRHQFHYGGVAGVPLAESYQDSSYRGQDRLTHSLMGKDIHFPMGDIELRELQHRSRRRRRNLLWQILCYPISCILTSEQIGRSFCFGAIDGMLTGSGILAAYFGLGILSHVNAFGTDTSSHEAMHRKWILVALTFASCFSDGICMAIGHVWSTRLVAGASFEERKDELRSFETSRSDAKARLVDILLLKGMLKIDAMSLADTLEGYPDLFVSALLGEGLGGVGGSGSGAGGVGGMVRVLSGDATNMQTMYNQIPTEWNVPTPAYAPGTLVREGLKYESYSEFSDLHQDPDVKTFYEIMTESRFESLFMMLSFGSFSVIPSLLYTFTPYAAGVFDPTNAHNDKLAISISFGVTSILMFLLGMWKR